MIAGRIGGGHTGLDLACSSDHAAGNGNRKAAVFVDQARVFLAANTQGDGIAGRHIATGLTADDDISRHFGGIQYTIVGDRVQRDDGIDLVIDTDRRLVAGRGIAPGQGDHSGHTARRGNHGAGHTDGETTVVVDGAAVFGAAGTDGNRVAGAGIAADAAGDRHIAGQLIGVEHAIAGNRIERDAGLGLRVRRRSLRQHIVVAGDRDKAIGVVADIEGRQLSIHLPFVADALVHRGIVEVVGIAPCLTSGRRFEIGQIGTLDQRLLQLGQLFGPVIGIGLETGEHGLVEQELGVLADHQGLTVEEFDANLAVVAGAQQVALVQFVTLVDNLDDTVDGLDLDIALDEFNDSDLFCHVSCAAWKLWSLEDSPQGKSRIVPRY